MLSRAHAREILDPRCERARGDGGRGELRDGDSLMGPVSTTGGSTAPSPAAMTALVALAQADRIDS
jgi:hypothetical protein